MGKMKRLTLGIIAALIVFSGMAKPAHAAFIDLPDSDPTIVSIDIYRNILETADMLIIVEENTPYASTPDLQYGSAFVWRLIDTDNTTEIAQALGFSFNEKGYGYNVISFYLSAAEFTAAGLAWEDPLKLRLSGTPVAFASPPTFTYDISASDYSSETVPVEVQLAIRDKVILIALDLNIQWALSAALSLVEGTDTTTVLSFNGQAFFRGAIFGIQAMAPAAFPLAISDVDVTDRTWTTGYADNLTGQLTGDLSAGLVAGQTLLDSNYNLFGLLLILGICAVIIFGNWYLAGGNLWKYFPEVGAVTVIGARMSLMGLGELGLLASLTWLYISAKMWRMI